ncbi:hypothetical protein [Streptomyces graminofaciens]|uniref:hypothetical protein n=1 Tax=Streptomyces graminofaciens TaxID=68212 RepID=UPI003D9B39BB
MARLAVSAGLDILLSNSRGPETLTDLVGDLGGHARATTPAEAACAGDLVVAIPLKAYDQLPVDALAHKTCLAPSPTPAGATTTSEDRQETRAR